MRKAKEIVTANKPKVKASRKKAKEVVVQERTYDFDTPEEEELLINGPMDEVADLAEFAKLSAEADAVERDAYIKANTTYVVQITCATCGETKEIGELGDADGIQAIVKAGYPLELSCASCGAHLALEIEGHIKE